MRSQIRKVGLLRAPLPVAHSRRREFLGHDSNRLAAAATTQRPLSHPKVCHIHSEASKKPYRRWLDPKLSPHLRVQSFTQVELGELGPPAALHDSVELADRCGRLGDFGGMKLAHEILDRVLAEKHHADHGDKRTQGPFPAPLVLFEKILYGWACLATQGAVALVRMRELMDLVKQVAKSEQDLFPKTDAESGISLRLAPTTNTYNTYLTGLRNAAKVSLKAAETARCVLDEMVDCHQKYGWNTKPNTKSYTFVLSAFANAKFRGAGMQAEQVLRRMQQVHREETEIYFSQVGVPYNTHDPQVNQRRIVTADAIAYSCVIRAHAQDASLESAQKARDLLMEAMQVNDGTVTVDLGLLTGVIAAFANVAENVRISTAIRRTAAEQAEEILETCLTDASGLDMIRQPVKQHDNIDLVAPYNACMNAYAKCDAPDSTLKAESLLQKLLTDFTEGKSSIHPDTVSFNTVLHGWARSGRSIVDAPQKAEDLMRLQIQLVEGGVLPESATPDCHSFAIVMLAYSRSRHPEKTQHTYMLLQELLQRVSEGKVKVRNDFKFVVPFTAVLDAAADPVKNNMKASTEGRGKADNRTFHVSHLAADDYSIALQTYREMKEDVFQVGCKPDHMTFAKMILVVAAHTDSRSAERKQMTELVFEDACQAGQVSRLVLSAVLKAIADKQFVQSLLQINNPVERNLHSVDELPRLWTRNVPPKFRQMNKDPLERRSKQKTQV